MSFLGLDVGTSGCKAVVFDRAGRQLALVTRTYAIRSLHPGWAELDSEAVGRACLEVIRQAASQCADDPVQGLAVSSQGEAFTVLDASGGVLADAMVSSDNRAVDLVDSLPASIGPQQLYEKTGHTPHPIFSLFKLRWLRQERPVIWPRAARVLCFEDFIHFRLGLEPAISFSLAARTMLFNVRAARWDADVLAWVGLREEQLARPLASGEVVGRLSAQVARELGLAADAVVVAGGHDQVCAALGCGALDEGVAALGSGTVECLTVTFAQPVLSPALRAANLCTYAHAAPDLYATLAYNLTGGNLLRWFLDEWPGRGHANETEDYGALLAAMPEEPTRLLTLPYFTGSGTPHFDNRTPAAILGLRFDTHRGEVLRALLEGLCFELGVNLRILGGAGIAVHTILVTGGGARSPRWLQLKADVLNLPIHIPEVTEAGCLGCAALACAAVTGVEIRSLLRDWVRIRATVYPDARRAAFYAARIVSYEKAYLALRALAAEVF